MGGRLEVFWWLMGALSLSMGALFCLPLIAGLWWGEAEWALFILPAVFSAGLGVGLLALGREHGRSLSVREGVLVMVLSWLLLAILGMMPYLGAGWDVATALLEAVSALTTTGLSALDFSRALLPRTLVLWHSLMTWLGGLTFMIILVTVLPEVSGCFGVTLQARQLLFFSPVWERMLASIRQGTGLYVGGTALAVLLFMAVGASPFTALVLALTLVSTGGSALGPFLRLDDAPLEAAGALVMGLAGCNMLLAYKAWARRSLSLWLGDTELRAFVGGVVGAGAAVSLYLYMLTGVAADSVRYGFFQVISFATTAGYVSAPVWQWPDFTRAVLLALALVGGCMGSAAGGLKVIRLVVLAKMALAELRRTLHPHLVLAVRLDGVPVAAKIMGRLLAFFFLYMAVLAAGALVIALAGLTPMAAISLAVGCVTSTGSTAALWGMLSLWALPDWALVACAALMILGRIEIFSFLVLVKILMGSRQKW